MKWVRVFGWGIFALSAAWGQPEQAFHLNDLGLAAAGRADYAEAERLYGEAMSIWKSLGPPYQAHLATTQGNLAETLCLQGKRQEGVKAYEEALAVHRRILGATNLRTLSLMNLLGGAYLMLGEDERAALLFDEALRTERELYPQDLQVARSLAGLGLLRLHAKKPDEALALSEEALRLVLRCADEKSLDVALAYANVGEAHRWLGHTDRALPLFRKAVSIYRSILGPDNPRVASALSQEGLIYMADGKYSMAEKDIVQALATLDKSCPRCTFEKLVVETNLGMLRLRQGKYAEADRILTRVVSTSEQYMARPGSDMATVLETLAEVRQRQHRYDEAARLHRRADLILGYR